MLVIDACTASTALGTGCEPLWAGIREHRSGLRRESVREGGFDSWLGRVDTCDETSLPEALSAWDCRNNRLAEIGLRQDGFSRHVEAAIEQYGPARVGVYLGTSTSGIGATEEAYRQLDDSGFPSWFSYERSHDFYSVCAYVKTRFGLTGPGMVISTACSSSAKVFASAARAMASGQCDAAVVGGVDSLCLTTLLGFNALQLMADEPCRPCDARRRGLSIGEAAGFALLTPDRGQPGVRLLGWGESSDAHHMTSPHPDGLGAALAMQRALRHARLAAGDVDYINLHGTGTASNDLAENRAISRVFGNAVPVSSTKGWTGHTLGAAGIVEAVLSMLCIQHQYLPENLNLAERDPGIETNVLTSATSGPVDCVLSNSFGFGGSNCSLLLGRAA